ncbi:MAG: hypothetical protein M1830_003982, partial [Pleopsidium flavum]
MSNLHVGVSNGPSAQNPKPVATPKTRRPTAQRIGWTKADLRTMWIAREQMISFSDIVQDFLPDRSYDAVRHKYMQVERDIKETGLGNSTKYLTPEDHLDWIRKLKNAFVVGAKFSKVNNGHGRYCFELDDSEGSSDEEEQEIEQEEDGEEDEEEQQEEEGGEDDGSEVDEVDEDEDEEKELPTAPANRFS